MMSRDVLNSSIYLTLSSFMDVGAIWSANWLFKEREILLLRLLIEDYVYVAVGG